MTENFLFYEEFGRTKLQSNFQQLAYSNLFADGTICLATSLELSRYICAICRNWNNYKPKNKLVANNKEDEKPKDMKGPPDNLYAFYSMYN